MNNTYIPNTSIVNLIVLTDFGHKLVLTFLIFQICYKSDLIVWICRITLSVLQMQMSLCVM